MQNFTKIICFSFLICVFFASSGVLIGGVSAQEQTQNFFVDSTYDLYGRKTIDATLVRSDGRLHFYVEKSWWDGRSSQEQNDLRIALAELGLEFQSHIYPTLTSMFGSEPKPGIDKDERITVLVHQMGSDAGGYFRTGNVYSKFQSPGSNEREMLYINSQYIGKSEAKSFLAHEFVHLITVNQKDLLRRVSEETWLNEARAEYAPTLLGYDDKYQGSNLERRVRDFLAKPSDPLVEWFNKKEDYGAVNLFVQYLIDHYGIKILADSLQSSAAGIASLNEALIRNGFREDFAKIFEDWSIAVLVNDCALGDKYCYRNKLLQDIRIIPVFYYIPRGETVFSTYHTATHWSSGWHRLSGGGQTLILEFDGSDEVPFTVPYVLCDSQDVCVIRLLSLDKEQKGSITLLEFDTKYNTLTIIPFAGNSTFGSNGKGSPFPFSWKIIGQKREGVGETELISQLLTRIAELQEQVRQLQVRLAVANSQNSVSKNSCGRLETDLSFEMNNGEVRCLQEFLKAQGPVIYPEGLITGNFLSLTKQAVIRFQEKYASEVLAPFGLKSGTGYVGQMTRNKINELLAGW